MIDILNLSREELKGLMKEMGELPFRGEQIFQWLHKGVENFNDMTNLSIKLKKHLEKECYINNIKIEKKLISKLDGTTKYLFLLEDYNIIEGVVMIYKHGLTACISTQVGCGMGCSFCASTSGGLVRNLKASEILGQIIAMQKDLGRRVGNIVLMGSGEPLHNFQAVTKFLLLANDEKGLNIGNRHITISTCGLVPEIIKLADMQIPINLAISLHSPTDKLRQQLMPVAKKYSIKELIEGCKYYLSKNNRRITFEYALIKGVNDGLQEANELSQLLKLLLCHVNLIPVNTVEERSFQKSKSDVVKLFEKELRKNGIAVTVRREMGADIYAACGQLRNSHIEGNKI